MSKPVRCEVVHVGTNNMTVEEALQLNALVKADLAIEGRVSGDEVLVVIDWAKISPDAAEKIHSS